jgi:hypothetical protein
MDKDSMREPGSPARKTRKWLPIWFKLAVLVLIGLIVSKTLGLQVFVEVTYDGIPFLAALTDVRIYLVPLLLILIYILSVWIWKKLFGPRDL